MAVGMAERRRASARERYWKDPEKARARARAWREKNPERRRFIQTFSRVWGDLVRDMKERGDYELLEYLRPMMEMNTRAHLACVDATRFCREYERGER